MTTRQPGFTLLELMITTILSAFLLLGASAMFMVFVSGNANTNIRRQINLEGQQVMSTIEYKLRNAKRVTDCGRSDQSSITFLDIAGEEHSFEVAGGFISIQTGADVQPLHSVFVTNSGTPFSCIEDPTSGKQQVSVTYTLEKAGSSSLNQTFKNTIDVRNTGLR